MHCFHTIVSSASPFLATAFPYLRAAAGGGLLVALLGGGMGAHPATPSCTVLAGGDVTAFMRAHNVQDSPPRVWEVCVIEGP